MVYSFNGSHKSLTIGKSWDFEKIVEHDIFRPLRLNHSFFFPPADLRDYVVVSDSGGFSDPTVVDINLNFMNP